MIGDYIFSGRSIGLTDIFIVILLHFSIVLTFVGNKILSFKKDEMQEICCHDTNCVNDKNIHKVQENDCQNIYIGKEGIFGIMKQEEEKCEKCDDCGREKQS